MTDLDFSKIYLQARKLPAMSMKDNQYTDTTRFSFSRRESHSQKPLIIINCDNLLYNNSLRKFNVSTVTLEMIRKFVDLWQIVLLISKGEEKLIQKLKVITDGIYVTKNMGWLDVSQIIDDF